MRLWHYKLIESGVLPKAMLVSQWRECIAIKRQWEKGTLKHRLVSYVMDNPKSMFCSYVYEVKCWLLRHHINYNENLYQEIEEFCDYKFNIGDYPEHNDRYLKQCLYNLQEKADRGIITQEEWKIIEDEFGDVL